MGRKKDIKVQAQGFGITIEQGKSVVYIDSEYIAKFLEQDRDTLVDMVEFAMQEEVNEVIDKYTL